MKLARPLILGVTLCLCLAALAYEVHNIVVDYVRPITEGTFGFVADFQFFHEGAQRFLQDPMTLYEGNTRDGFLLIGEKSRIDYGYPPPAVLLFVPFASFPTSAAFPAFLILSAVITGLCVVLFKSLHDRDRKRPRWDLRWWIALAFAFACGMTYVTYVFGQVNAVVLLVCLLYVACVMDERYTLAGVLIGIGFWLKFYPVFLLALAPLERRPIRLLIASFLGIALIPVVLLPVLPLELYRQYFFEVYPGLAAQTSPHVYNQSLIGWMTRFQQPRSMFFDWGPLLVDPRVKALNLLAMAAIFGATFLAYRCDRARPLWHYACILAAAPMVVTYGWGGTYMLALPLLLLAVVTLASGGRGSLLSLPVVVAAFLIPAYRPFDFGDRFGPVAAHVFYSRYLYLTVVLLIWALWARKTKPAPA